MSIKDIDDYDAECSACPPHLARNHPVDDVGDPMSYAPCRIPHCGCRDFDGMDHPDRPSLADTKVFLTQDGWVTDV